jgi:hypothetical protein
MKQLFAMTLIGISLSTPIFAEEAELREGPCNKIMEACKAYVKTAGQKKSRYRDCFQPLLKGEKLEGVQNITESDIKACQANKAELKK